MKYIKMTVLSNDKYLNYDFSPNINIVEQDNGNGKSTLLNCIYYALGISPDLKKFNKIDKTVFLKFENNGKTFFSATRKLGKKERTFLYDDSYNQVAILKKNSTDSLNLMEINYSTYSALFLKEVFDLDWIFLENLYDKTSLSKPYLNDFFNFSFVSEEGWTLEFRNFKDKNMFSNKSLMIMLNSFIENDSEFYTKVKNSLENDKKILDINNEIKGYKLILEKIKSKKKEMHNEEEFNKFEKVFVTFQKYEKTLKSLEIEKSKLQRYKGVVSNKKKNLDWVDKNIYYINENFNKEKFNINNLLYVNECNIKEKDFISNVNKKIKNIEEEINNFKNKKSHFLKKHESLFKKYQFYNAKPEDIVVDFNSFNINLEINNKNEEVKALNKIKADDKYIWDNKANAVKIFFDSLAEEIDDDFKSWSKEENERTIVNYFNFENNNILSGSQYITFTIIQKLLFWKRSKIKLPIVCDSINKYDLDPNNWKQMGVVLNKEKENQIIVSTTKKISNLISNAKIITKELGKEHSEHEELDAEFRYIQEKIDTYFEYLL